MGTTVYVIDLDKVERKWIESVFECSAGAVELMVEQKPIKGTMAQILNVKCQTQDWPEP